MQLAGAIGSVRKRGCRTSLSEERNSAVDKMSSKCLCDIHGGMSRGGRGFSQEIETWQSGAWRRLSRVGGVHK